MSSNTATERLAIASFGSTLTPDELKKLPPGERRDVLKRLRRKTQGKLLLHHGILGGLGVVIVAIIFLVVLLQDYNVFKYLSCFYTAFGDPTLGQQPTILSHGCVSGFYVSVVALGLYSIFYHLVLLIPFVFREYIRMLLGGRYNQPFRWMARAATISVYLLIALEVSGMRNLIAAFILIVLHVLAEGLRLFGERRTVYIFDTRTQRTELKTVGVYAHRAAAYFSSVIVLVVLISWIFFVAQGASDVPLITWLYGPAFILLYAGFAGWAYVATTAKSVAYGSRLSLEYKWDIYNGATLLFWTIIIIIGSGVQLH